MMPKWKQIWSHQYPSGMALYVRECDEMRQYTLFGPTGKLLLQIEVR